uniref:Uncharacterized protein n=1 Tax=Anguilla anguilla TaxID=7936 RepID=A0A0E9RKA5_ANGAN
MAFLPHTITSLVLQTKQWKQEYLSMLYISVQHIHALHFYI